LTYTRRRRRIIASTFAGKKEVSAFERMSSSPGGASPPAPAANDSSNTTSSGGQWRNKKNRRTGRESKFEGKCADIKSSVYDVVSGKDTFAKTTREITEYVSREFEDAGEFRTGIVEMQLTPLVEPPPLPADQDPINFELWKMARQKFEKQSEAHHKNSSWVYALVLGQCSQALCNWLEASKCWN
jgi:hypothetical protein